MVKAIYRSSLREIRQSLGRYLAILAIVGLGVGFFAGLRMCQPSMAETGIGYLEQYRLYDFRLLSTLGFTEEDAAYFASLEGVAGAEGAVYADFLADLDGGDQVLKAHSLTEGVNRLELTAGRMPQAPDECVGDNRFFTEADLGRAIPLSESCDEDTRELFACGSYTLVGLAASPYYLNYERGTASIGSGSVAGFVYIPEAGFDCEAYYELFLSLDGAAPPYSQAYSDQIDALKEAMEDRMGDRADLRYDTLYADAMEEIRDGERELADGWQEYDSELADVSAELADAYRELTDGEADYAQGLRDYEQGKRDYAQGLADYADGEQKITDAQLEIEDARQEIAGAQQELADGWQEYYDGKAEAEQELADALRKLEDGEREYAGGVEEYEDGRKKLEDAQREIEDGEEELARAERKIADGERELRDGERQLRDGEEELDSAWRELRDAERELQAGEAELLAAREQLEAGEAQYAQLSVLYQSVCGLTAQINQATGGSMTNEALIDALPNLVQMGLVPEEQAAQLSAGWRAAEAQLGAVNETTLGALSASLEEGREACRQGEAQYEAGRRAYLDGLRQYEEGEAELAKARRELEDGKKELADGRRELEDGKKELADGRKELEEGRAELADALIQLQDARKELLDGWAEYYDGKAEAEQELDKALRELHDGEMKLEEGRQELADGEQELRDAVAELADAKVELEDAAAELAKAPGELADARKELDDGWTEYLDGAAEADAEFADARRELDDGQVEIADAYEQLSELEPADTYVLTRMENTGYAAFDNDTSIIAAISLVFPAFFFLVAALVCMTTMTRMVDEQRTQIGVLKALGYSDGQIMGRYLFYAGSAATLGAVLGYALCCYGLPWIIWQIYGIMYSFADLKFVFSPGLAAVSYGAALLCSMGATYLSCRAELKRQAAELIRPKAPRAGQRIFLEYIPALWRRLGFLRKVSVRNVFRYRSRLVMMVLGIGGCTALLLTGFGIRDSIKSVVDEQYESITLYDYGIAFSTPQTPETAGTYLAEQGWPAEDALLAHAGSTDIIAPEGTKSVYLTVSSTDTLEGFISLHSGAEAIPDPGPGEAVVSAGLAQSLGLQIGTEVQLRSTELGTVTASVSGVCDNYIQNFVFVSPQTYREQLGTEPDYQMLYLRSDGDEDPYEEGVRLSEGEDVGSVTVNASIQDRVNGMLSRLDYIVLIVVVCAGALAFIVLYNLTNININERIREIATIKVLGFYQKEVAAYVFREINMLSLLGSIAGLGMGRALHAFVISQIHVDGVFFPSRVDAFSYIISVGLTLLFTVLITLAMRPRLRKIDMAESLKSIE